jgi:rhodanese-related sulfurtransferase
MNFDTIDRQRLNQKLSSSVLDNDDPESGLALVNVLGKDVFDEKHIPNSVNIPLSEIDQFERRFGKEKDIIVYCASSTCDASRRAATALSQRGFSNVSAYEGGLADWEEAHQPIEGRAASRN